ncbi:MAG: glutamate synthase subunit beta [Phycisphaerae bacterium]
MADPKGFLEFDRKEASYKAIEERVKHYHEFLEPLADEDLQVQAARCMDCGIPFCHSAGCPVKNRIPEFNDLVWQNRWKEASDNLHSTNNFPEITGRVCPAPCEEACTLSINEDPVLIKHIEYKIAERAFAEGWVQPIPPKIKTGKRVAVVGSGPAGLAAAQQLARKGHDVVVFEKDDRIGGLLRYGIPDFKMEKHIIDRRARQMEAEGVEFQVNVNVGRDLSGRYLRQRFDAILLSMGAGQPRDLPVPGRELDGIEYAMDFLTPQNKVNAGDTVANQRLATGKHVVVIGGGDTGSDCVGTSIRQGAKSVQQFEILPKPANRRPRKTNWMDYPSETPWPLWPKVLRTSTSHKEGCERRWSVATREFTGKDGKVKKLHGVQVEWTQTDGGWKMKEIAGTEFTVQADLVLLAMGFVHVIHEGLISELSDMGMQLDGRGNVKASRYATDIPGVYTAGDTMVGASLVVTAINSGREAAAEINQFLKDK